MGRNISAVTLIHGSAVKSYGIVPADNLLLGAHVYKRWAHPYQKYAIAMRPSYLIYA